MAIIPLDLLIMYTCMVRERQTRQLVGKAYHLQCMESALPRFRKFQVLPATNSAQAIRMRNPQQLVKLVPMALNIILFSTKGESNGW